MTRRAKERRMERVQGKQRAAEERALRDQTLSARPEWRQLLVAIDGPPATQRISQQQSSPPKPPPPQNQSQIVNALQWKSTHVPIAAASVFQLPIKLDAPKGVLHYEFYTRDYDVNFSVQMICADGTMVELVEPQRYESQKQHITARLELVGPGMVLLIWDNSFSWLNTKQLAYTIELTQETPEISAERKTALAQRARYDRERALLSKDTELDRLQTTIEAHDQSIEFFKKQIEGLQEQLHKREEEKEASEKQKQSVEEQIETLAWEIRALNWRSLDKAVLSNVANK
uniref:GOLD domain-containing protein n=1 Tax=Globisporangium ultimum (strain ATCC 200006 / CBS 805.95 / DAOM BR144) TaxID=431595 RepID=K3WZ08_GLOUD